VGEVTLAEGLCDREEVQVMHPHNFLYLEISLTNDKNHGKPSGLTSSAI
jgi:hypothetical protein